MKFMIMRKADSNTEAGVMPTNEQLSDMADYNTAMAEAGVFVTGEGLKPSKKGFRIKFTDGKPVISDGPFTETKELLAGYTIIETGSKQEALDWVKRWPETDVELEMREVFELSDFDEGEGLQKHVDLNETLKKRPVSMCNYLLFNGNCREAFEFYADLLGGEIMMLLTGGESPMKDDMPAEMHDKVMHVCLKVGNWMLMGSDCPPDMFEQPQGFHVQIGMNNIEQAEQTFDRLAEGGTIQMPFEKTFWAERFGIVVDRFGTPWMINCAQCI
ncbi:YciI family protein [Methylophaga sp. OBS4]|uniref:YciI family protein n=1 Tax=Methylophaga sp. OBS4 TaxID=2991935 RepID=UPI00225579B4|nr:YciI family protein [Methylophaga sp. OBS4]